LAEFSFAQPDRNWISFQINSNLWRERERKIKKEKAPLSLLSSTIIINKEAENFSSFCNKCEE
jgi:hypothetical protein